MLTDIGSEYKSKMFAEACQKLDVKRVFTQPNTPQTNGKAERFIQTLLCECAYARTYRSSVQRNLVLEPFLHMYNWHRPHRGINGFSPGEKPQQSRVYTLLAKFLFSESEGNLRRKVSTHKNKWQNDDESVKVCAIITDRNQKNRTD